MIFIVGIGPGSREYILPAAKNALKNCEYIIGFSRAINSLSHIEGNKIIIESLSETLSFIEANSKSNIALAASGDPCFYGITDYIKRNFNGELKIIPGLSSFQYMTAKLNISWQNAYLGSLHGREEELIEAVRGNKLSIWLTDKVNCPSIICKRLVDAGILGDAFVGENLSYEDEKITKGNFQDIASKVFSPLSVLIIISKNEE